MTVKDLKALLAFNNIPDDAEIDLFNRASEWYGIVPLELSLLKAIDGRVVINVGGEWEEADGWLPSDVDCYREDRLREVGREVEGDA